MTSPSLPTSYREVYSFQRNSSETFQGILGCRPLLLPPSVLALTFVGCLRAPQGSKITNR